MTEIEIIKELFRAFSTKEEICVVLADGSSRSGEVCSFDGEKILLGGEEIAVGSIVSVGKDEAIPAQPILETVTEETHTGFISALQNGDKEEVERYFANPELLMAEGFTDQEVDAICRKKSNPIPWSDDERNAKYNQARRVYEILGTKDGIAQQLFEAALSTNLPSKVEKKVISALLDIYCSDSPEKLLAFWDEYQDKLLQGSFWSFRLAKALVSLREFSKLNDIVNTIPSDSDFFKKVIGDLIDIYSAECPERLSSLWVAYKEIITQSPFHILKLFKGFVRLKDYYSAKSTIDSMSENTDPEQYKKAVGGLLDLCCAECPDQLTLLWDSYKHIIAQNPHTLLKVARTFIQTKAYSKVKELLDVVPAGVDMYEVPLVTAFIAKHGKFEVAPNELESALIAGDIPMLRLIALNADALTSMGYSADEIKLVQDSLHQNINFAAKDELSIARRIFSFQKNKNRTAEYYYISAIQAGRKIAYSAKWLFSLYMEEGCHEELQLVFERYLSGNWQQHADETGSIYILSLIQSGKFQKAFDFWKQNAEFLQIDPIVLLYMLLENRMPDEEIKSAISLPLKVTTSNADYAKYILCQFAGELENDLIRSYLVELYNASFALLDHESIMQIKTRLGSIADFKLNSTAEAGLYALVSGFDQENGLIAWFNEIALQYTSKELINAVRNIIAVYLENDYVQRSDVGSIISHIQNLGEDIPGDLLEYLRPQFASITEQNAWFDQCIDKVSDIDEAGFELFCQIAKEANDSARLHQFLCALARRNVLFAHRLVEQLTDLLREEVSAKLAPTIVNESLCALALLGNNITLPLVTLEVMSQGFLFVGKYTEAFILGSALRDHYVDNVNASCAMLSRDALNGYSLFGVLLHAFSSNSIFDVDELVASWGKYFRITEDDISQLSEMKDYYKSPEKWTNAAKESLAKHLFVSATTPLYWQLMSIAHNDAEPMVRVNIQFHKAIAEKASTSTALENAIGYGIHTYATDILQNIFVTDKPDEFIKCSSLIIRVVRKHPEVLNSEIAVHLLHLLHENKDLRTDLRAWECVLDVAMEIAFIGNTIECFADWFSPYLATSYAESNCRFLCNLLIYRPEETELILSTYEKLQNAPQKSPLIQIVTDILSSAGRGVLTDVQRDVLKVVTQCRKIIDDDVLYKYYATSVAHDSSEHILAVLGHFERYAPTLHVFDDVKKYEILREDASDSDVLALYNAEFASLKELDKPERIATALINLVPGELYLKSKGQEIESAFDLGRRLLGKQQLSDIIARKESLVLLDKIFTPEEHPGLAQVFLKCLFTRQWGSLIRYDVSNNAINDVIRADDTIKNLLAYKRYEILKSGILSLLNANLEDAALIDRVDALFATCGGIRRSKNYLRRIGKMEEADREALRKVFSLRIESTTLRRLGLIGSAILGIPGNEKVAFILGMLTPMNLAALFDNNECLNTLTMMPRETAIAIAEIYITFFYRGADNVFSRYLKKQTDGTVVTEFSQPSEESSQNACRALRVKYGKAKSEYEMHGNLVPKLTAQKYERIKAEYLYAIVREKSHSDLESLAPSPVDYLSVITYLFNRQSAEDIKAYIWKLDTSLLMPCLSHVMTLLEQYPQAYMAANKIPEYDWKIAALQLMNRALALKTISEEDREIRRTLVQQIPDDRKYILGKFYPAKDQQKPVYVEKMHALLSVSDELIKYMAFNGLDVSWATVDVVRFNECIARYSCEEKDEEAPAVVVAISQDSSIHDAIVELIHPGYLANAISSVKAMPVEGLVGNVVPEINACIGMLKHLAEKSNDFTSRTDLYTARNLVRWIYLLRIEETGFSREIFIQVLNLISDEDSIYKVQWDYILTSLYHYFENIESLQNLTRIMESDLAGLSNISSLHNPQVRILRNADINEWKTIVDVLGNLAGIDFTKSAESEQTLRLIGCRTKLISIIENKTSSLFDPISNNLLLLINTQIAALRHNPELSISVCGESLSATQTILWEDDNRTGKLYAVISNVGGADCKQVSLVSYINTRRVKECWINTIYVGEKVPFEQAFSIDDLIAGVVTWEIELSYFDTEKGKPVVVAHKSTAAVHIGGEPLDRGHISTGNPARGKNFVGRTRELAILRKHYSDISEIPSLLIRGLRRSGKSSILLRLADGLRKKEGLLVVAVDGQSIAGNIKSAFIDKVLDSIRMNYRSHPDYADIMGSQFVDFVNTWKANTANANWIGQLDVFYYELSQLFQRKLLIFIDEMESIFYSNRFKSAPEEEMLYSALRSLVQKKENFVSFVFCGSDKLLTSCLEQRRESQMFQTLQFIEIGRMNSADIREIFRLQSEKYDVKFTSDAVDTIWQYTHGLVWYAKLLGYIVINNILENDLTIRAEITRCDISNAVQMLIDGEIGTDKYDLVDASLNTARSAIVHAMASVMPDFNKEVSVDEISTALKLMQTEGYKDPRNGEPVPTMNEKTIKQHLMFLERMQLLIANTSKTKYSFAAELYRLFFRKEKKLHVFEERRLK